MDALMPALVAAIGCLLADRPAWLAAILADRFGPGRVLAGAAAALLAAGAVAVAGGVLLAPMLTPEAKALFLGVALALQGIGGWGRIKAPDPLAGWRLPGMGVAAIGLFIHLFGDGLTLIVGALAARSSLPWAALAGMAVGGVAALAPAAVLGEDGWRRWPLRPFRQVSAAGFLLAGLWMAVSALGLV